jgi:hypothetical protein
VQVDPIVFGIFPVRYAAPRLGIPIKALYRLVAEDHVQYFRIGNKVCFTDDLIKLNLRIAEMQPNNPLSRARRWRR